MKKVYCVIARIERKVARNIIENALNSVEMRRGLYKKYLSNR